MRVRAAAQACCHPEGKACGRGRQTLRREWERYQQRINVRGEVILLDPWDRCRTLRGPRRTSRALQQSCPHPNACLTCDHFLTTAEFLPQHRDQLVRTEELIAAAEGDGRRRLVEMNEPVRFNLVRIIDGLETIGAAAGDAG